MAAKTLACDAIMRLCYRMRSTVIKETKYRGYRIKPTVKGFRVYRKEYYIGQYPSLSRVRLAIDTVLEKKKNLTIPGDSSAESKPSGQFTLF